MQVKYPNVKVQLSNQDGNAMSIIARVRRALRRADVPNDEVEQFSREAMSGDYDNVIQTAMKWVDVS
jgi:hypothetical protein